jgi:4-hydroxybenzoyl-CoA reductase subunit beta
MMRVPSFRYLAPKTIAEAVEILRGEGPDAKLIAGGTDLIPNMKRRQQMPKVLVGLRGLDALKAVTNSPGDRLTLGAGVTLTDIGAFKLAPSQRALRMAAGKVATPHIRNMGTIGGNLCLDTRCNYYNQNYDWRKAIDYCKKAPGPSGVALEEVQPQGVCWVAPGSKRCWAVSSSDTAPALMALGAEVTLVSADGERRIPLAELYNDDGMAFLTKAADELLTAVHLPASDPAWRSTYWKLRRRGSFDFPVLGVGAAVKLDDGGVVTEARLALGAVASYPILVDTSALLGQKLTDEVIEAFAKTAAKPAKPMDNTDYELAWRKTVCKRTIASTLRELRGDDPATLGVFSRRAFRLTCV